jgi:large subunit ribosomal protein L31
MIPGPGCYSVFPECQVPENDGRRGPSCISFMNPFYFHKKIVLSQPEIRIKMKNEIHPKEYRLVVFKDVSNEYSFLTRSCVNTKESIVWEDGKEYPLFKVEISNTSHPYFTGKMKFVDTAGRVDKFMNKYKKHVGKQKKGAPEDSAPAEDASAPAAE